MPQDHHLDQSQDQPLSPANASITADLARMHDALHQLQEAQAYASHDADGFGKQLIVLQQQVQALSRRLTTLEAKLVQRSLDAQSETPDE